MDYKKILTAYFHDIRGKAIIDNGQLPCDGISCCDCMFQVPLHEGINCPLYGVDNEIHKQMLQKMVCRKQIKAIFYKIFKGENMNRVEEKLSFDEFCKRMRGISGYNAYSSAMRAPLENDYKVYESFYNKTYNKEYPHMEKPKAIKNYVVGKRTRIKSKHHCGLSGVVKEIHDNYLILAVGSMGAKVRVNI